MVSTNLISTKFTKILSLSFFITLIVHMLLFIDDFLVSIALIIVFMFWCLQGLIN